MGTGGASAHTGEDPRESSVASRAGPKAASPLVTVYPICCSGASNGAVVGVCSPLLYLLEVVMVMVQPWMWWLVLWLIVIGLGVNSTLVIVWLWLFGMWSVFSVWVLTRE